jgi:hypothetical protein
MRKYDVGDRVIVNYPSYGLKEHLGTIRAFYREDRYSVEFDPPFSGGHDCDIGISGSRGLWIDDRDIVSCVKGKKIPAEKPSSKPKFGVGDRVVVRYWDDMRYDYPDLFMGDIKGPQNTFTTGMKAQSGKIAKITDIKDDGRFVLEWESSLSGYSWYDWMFSLVEKAPPKKKMTLAEIEKVLGYGIEIKEVA